MPSGLLPTYGYTPPNLPNVPAQLRTCSSRRARLFAGGTYFRSTDPGRASNNITAQIIQEDSNAYLIIQNNNTSFAENVIGNVVVTMLDLSTAKWSDLWIIDRLDTITPRAQYYSISCQIAFARRFGLPYTLPAPLEVSTFNVGKLFMSSGKLMLQTQKSAIGFTSTDTISIAPRFRIYQLSALSATPPADPVTGIVPATQDGWDIDDMRTQVTADNPWVQMLERSGATKDPLTGVSTPNANPKDIQDTGTDDLVASLFDEKALSGGDGLPDNPVVERTGPSRSIVFVNYGEQQNGSLGDLNTVYEWVGDNAQSGVWKPY